MDTTRQEAIEMALLALEDCPGLQEDVRSAIAARAGTVSTIAGILDAVANQCRDLPHGPVSDALPHSRLAKDPFAMMKPTDLSW